MIKKNTKNGELSNKILIYGKHPFFSILKTGKRKIYSIYVSNKNKKEFYDILSKENISINSKVEVNFVDNTEIDKIFNNREKNHQGYLMKVAARQKITFDDFINSLQNVKDLPKLLILDQILDPHNLGAIIRTSVAFGIEKIIITSYNSVKDTPIVAKASVGLNEFVDLIEVVNLNNAIKSLKNVGYFIIGLDGEAKITIDKITDSRNLALVLGNEGKGIRELVKRNCDELVKIPMENCAESLNVSVATAIAIYQVWR